MDLRIPSAFGGVSLPVSHSLWPVRAGLRDARTGMGGHAAGCSLRPAGRPPPLVGGLPSAGRLPRIDGRALPLDLRADARLEDKAQLSLHGGVADRRGWL